MDRESAKANHPSRTKTVPNVYGIEHGKPLPAGIIGIKGTQVSFDKAEAVLGNFPASFKLVHPEGLQIRFFRVPDNFDGHKFTLAHFGLVLLLPGTVFNARWQDATGASDGSEVE